MSDIKKFKRPATQVGVQVPSNKGLSGRFKEASIAEFTLNLQGNDYEFSWPVPPSIKNEERYLDGVKHRLQGGALTYKLDENGNRTGEKDVSQLKESFRLGFRDAGELIVEQRAKQGISAMPQKWHLKRDADSGGIKTVPKEDEAPMMNTKGIKSWPKNS